MSHAFGKLPLIADPRTHGSYAYYARGRTHVKTIKAHTHTRIYVYVCVRAIAKKKGVAVVADIRVGGGGDVRDFKPGRVVLQMAATRAGGRKKTENAEKI